MINSRHSPWHCVGRSSVGIRMSHCLYLVNGSFPSLFVRNRDNGIAPFDFSFVWLSILLAVSRPPRHLASPLCNRVLENEIQLARVLLYTVLLCSFDRYVPLAGTVALSRLDTSFVDTFAFCYVTLFYFI